MHQFKFKKLVVAGAGAGYWLVWALCRDVGGRIPIEVYDDDTFQGGNGFRRLPKVVNDSTYKVDLLRIQISLIMGDVPPIVHRKKLLPEDFSNGDWSETLVVDATDMNVLDREDFWEALKQSGAKGIRVSHDGLGVATVSPGPPLIAGDQNIQGYTILPTLSQSLRASAQGAEAILYALQTGKILEFQTFVPTSENESIEI